MKKSEIHARYEDCRQRGLTVAETARELGCLPKNVYSWSEYNRKPFTKCYADMGDLFEQCRVDGMTITETARHCGVYKCRVHYWARTRKKTFRKDPRVLNRKPRQKPVSTKSPITKALSASPRAIERALEKIGGYA